MKITENEEEIVIRDVPVFSWVIGVLCSFLFGGCFFWTILYAFYNPREIFHSMDGTWAGSAMAVVVYIVFLLVVFGLFAAMIAFILSSVITTKINRKSQFVEITRRNLLRKNVKRYDFLQIKRFKTESRVAGRLGLTYYIALQLQNDRIIEIEEKGFSDSDAEGIIKRLNEFAGFPAKKKRVKMKRAEK